MMKTTKTSESIESSENPIENPTDEPSKGNSSNSFGTFEITLFIVIFGVISCVAVIILYNAHRTSNDEENNGQDVVSNVLKQKLELKQSSSKASNVELLDARVSTKGAMSILSTSGGKSGAIQKPKNKAIGTDEAQMAQIINNSGAHDNHQHDKHDEQNEHNEHSHEDLYIDHGVTSPGHDDDNNGNNNINNSDDENVAIELAIERNNYKTSRANEGEGGIGHDGDDIHEAQIEGTQRGTRGGAIGAVIDNNIAASANQANDTSNNWQNWNAVQVSNWLHQQLEASGMKSENIINFIKEFENHDITGKMLETMKKDNSIIADLRNEFKIKSFGIWKQVENQINGLP